MEMIRSINANTLASYIVV